jgi:peroxiredoxin
MQVSQNTHHMGKGTKKSLWIGGVLLTLLVGGGVTVSLWNSSDSKKASSFRAAPDFALPDAQGKIYKLSEFKGKVVLLHFWASWCPPCLGELPHFMELAQTLQGKQIQVLAVSLDESWQAAHKVLPTDRLPQGVVSLIDPKTKVSENFGSYAFPETYLISPKGEIITKWVGPQDWKSPEFLKMMETMAQKAEINQS